MRVCPLILLFALGGCAAGSGPLAEVDPAALPETPTWTSHARGILDLYCAGCHAEDAQPGALEGYDYSDCARAKRGVGGTYQAAFRSRIMPPPTGFPMPTAARETLQRWYDQGATCE